MDPKLVAILTLRGMSSLFSMQGNSAVATAINVLLNAYEAGRNVDAYMGEIAEKLKTGASLEEWEDIASRINSEVDEFLAREAGPD